MGIKGEPSTPTDPAQGLVWGSILEQIDFPGSESDFISVGDTIRTSFSKHPWSIGGGGIGDVKEFIEERATETLEKAAELGIAVVTLEDDAFQIPKDLVRRRHFDAKFVRGFVVGDVIRDWGYLEKQEALFPHEGSSFEPCIDQQILKWLWPLKTRLEYRQWFKKSQIERGLEWYAYGHISREKFTNPISISYAFVSTHNHFLLETEGKVFNRSAPVIKLPLGKDRNHHLGLVGLLNSSVACFWMKQIFHNKGSTVDQHGARQRTDAFEDFFEFTSTGLKDFPIPSSQPVDLAARIQEYSNESVANLPSTLLAADVSVTRELLEASRYEFERLRRLMIGAQEDLDWTCYSLYGLLPAGVGLQDVIYEAPIEVSLGERAFEIQLGRRMAAGHEQTTWFNRHGSMPITEIPTHWPERYRNVVERRIELLAQDKSIGLIERPEFKRRWNFPKWQDLQQAALRDWLLARLESNALWFASADQPPQIGTTSQLAEIVQRDVEFMQIATLFSGHADFDIAQLVAGLVAAESVPFLPALRYSDTGIRKRAQWDSTWVLQRREDCINADVVATEGAGWMAELTAEARIRFMLPTAVALTAEAKDWVDRKLADEIKRYQDERKTNEIGAIPVPPKYLTKDFLKTDFWRLRGGLDVPKERWVSYPGCERGADGSLPIAWAGWDHLQQATALAAYYLEMKESEGWEAARLQPLLAGLLELVPWLEQWHNDVHPVYGERMGAYYKGFVSEEARAHGFTLDNLRGWKPAVIAAKRGRKKASA